MMEEVYEPREDSYLLLEYAERYSKADSVLDMGTGSGIIAINLAKKAKTVVAADINPKAVNTARMSAEIGRIKNIEFLESDIFEKIKGSFDLICFNPPYLPKEKKVEDIALFSGKRGVDTAIRFLDEANRYLKEEGIILLISSSLASQTLLKEAMKRNLFDEEILSREHIFFEDIILHKLTKSKNNKSLHKAGISDFHLFAHGKRGVVIKGRYKNKIVAVKIKKDTSEAFGTIENEIRFLKIFNKKDIGPNFIENDAGFLMYEFVNGVFIEEFIEKSNKEKIFEVLKRIFNQLYIMDKIGINKFEMHHPYKHIIVNGKNPVLIDFERCRHTEDPKNVTEFCDYLMSKKLTEMMENKKIRIDKEKMISAAKKYKETLAEREYKNILGMLK